MSAGHGISDAKLDHWFKVVTYVFPHFRSLIFSLWGLLIISEVIILELWGYLFPQELFNLMDFSTLWTMSKTMLVLHISNLIILSFFYIYLMALLCKEESFLMNILWFLNINFSIATLEKVLKDLLPAINMRARWTGWGSGQIYFSL